MTQCGSSLLANFDTKDAKRSVIKWALSFRKIFLKNTFIYLIAGPPKIRPLHTYEELWRFYFGWICALFN